MPSRMIRRRSTHDHRADRRGDLPLAQSRAQRHLWVGTRQLREPAADRGRRVANAVRGRAATRFRALRSGDARRPVRLHRIHNEQLYHYYLGDPLEVFLLHSDGSSERVVIGPDLRAGQRVQLRSPATHSTPRA